MAPMLSFDRLRSILTATVAPLPDYRTRPNRVYEIADVALGAFAVFFMQSPSFLAHQRDMQRTKGQNNARSLFGINQVPSDPHPKCWDQAVSRWLRAGRQRCWGMC